MSFGWNLSCFSSFSVAGDINANMSRTCDVMCAADHIVRFTRPTSYVFAYCRRSEIGAGKAWERGYLILLYSAKFSSDIVFVDRPFANFLKIYFTY